MPHATNGDENDFKPIQVTELHPTFGAEVHGVDFSKPVPEDVFSEIYKAITKYGILVFRHALLDDDRHVAFSRLFGELDDVKPYLALGRKNRFTHDELFDVSNLEDDGTIAQPNTRRHHLGQGNTLFHVDSSFNPRRAGFSLLRAHALPPRGTGGNTDFADARQAFDELNETLKQLLLREDYVAAHSLWHSRKMAAAGQFDDVDPRALPFGRHKLVQRHEASGRMNLYIAAHKKKEKTGLQDDSGLSVDGEAWQVHHLERRRSDGSYDEVPWEEGKALIDRLMKHATRKENVLSVEWRNEGDLVVWDNTCVMHRAGPGSFQGRFVRDMRRCTVHDGSVHAWGLNEIGGERMGLP